MESAAQENESYRSYYHDPVEGSATRKPFEVVGFPGCWVKVPDLGMG